jgi:hypothetical protein
MSTYSLQQLKSVGQKATEYDGPTEPRVTPDLPLRVGGYGTTWSEARNSLVADLHGPSNPTTLTEVARATVDNRHRQFTPAWSRWTWRRLLAHHRWVRTWQESTILLTFTGRTTLPGADRPIPPVTHCERIRASRQARNKALSRALDDVDRWSSITVVGAHETGHCHVHTGVWTGESVGADRFEPVVQAHLNQCGLAQPEGHGTGAITVRSDSARLIGELGKNTPGLDTRGDRSHGVLSDPEYKQFGATVLQAGGWRAVRF